MKIDNLDTFTIAYITCALWSSNDESTPQGGEPMDRNYSMTDIAPETLRSMRDDCARFQEAHAALIERAGLSAESAGHDFWLTRNRHGAGFWDRGLGDVGEKLTDAARAFGECNLYVGDDRRIYL